ncbi:MAG: biopolymer transporter ExbD [Saprospirales bacterium]|nr:MAG: biopolymer transporter ExbD [Saprospirales bacterium]
MGLKKRSRVSAEFSMSSLTDIIFLLLIFFMLTSSLVQINVELPESDARTVAPTDVTVAITAAGQFTLNGRNIDRGSLDGAVRQAIEQSENRQNATVTIVAEKGVDWNEVSEITRLANRLQARAIIATKPKSS